ncbi:hypothetical protein CAPTEDRAFT_99768 [Capitella teleta]|uniref:RING-type domain-containing protein n=1 Tax=Capitella teleta TaxID=283909 RepID=R7UWR4_CAPTE|nr:hypothetical protein CAPTEDRAFT_99768 [Capitella teleta]|eukprot:ELU10687.1 hypothetical protein CAPTEDRAFT_99768 [Capitella teleta]
MDTHQERTVKIEDTIAMLQKTFECPICLDLMKNAVSTKCDHKFCRLCIQKAIGHKSSIPCPICKDPTTKRSLQKLTHWNKIMDKVRELPSAFEADSGIQCECN